jgi:hypothetical protein
MVSEVGSMGEGGGTDDCVGMGTDVDDHLTVKKAPKSHYKLGVFHDL